MPIRSNSYAGTILKSCVATPATAAETDISLYWPKSVPQVCEEDEGARKRSARSDNSKGEDTYNYDRRALMKGLKVLCDEILIYHGR